MSLRDRLMALLGISAYSAPKDPPGDQSLSDPKIQRAREAFGGQLSPPPQSQTRWYLKDVEAAKIAADAGIMERIARLMRAARGDGVVAGLLSTATDGLVALPKRFVGHPDVVNALEQGHESARSDFDEMFPPTELGRFVADYILCQIAVGELVRVEGREFPVFVRRDPEFLVYRWSENRWYFRSILGLIPITPGDGEWVLLTGGREAPWQGALWEPVGNAFIRKQHAQFHKDNWEAKLANPARVAVAPQGASEPQKQSWFQKVMAWGVNTVFGLTPGYDVKLLESNGRGYESFLKTTAEQNNEIIIAIAGQTVTTDGGAGFQNSDIHKTIRADRIQATAAALAHCINTQGLPVYIVSKFGLAALKTHATVMGWDTTPPKDLNASATAMVNCANAVERLTAALAPHGYKPDVAAICAEHGVRIVKIDPAAAAANGKPDLRVVYQEAA